MSRRIALIFSLFLTLPLSLGSQSAPDLRGFTNANATAERELERRFQALQTPSNLREYMRTITDEPHHAGSPGGRKVAEYILGKFKGWGLNASIEEFEALMPYPT